MHVHVYMCVCVCVCACAYLQQLMRGHVLVAEGHVWSVAEEAGEAAHEGRLTCCEEVGSRR